jgi:hypothetical protein
MNTITVDSNNQMVTKASSYIWVTFRKEGIHKYPAAATDPKLATGDWLDVSFLGTPHRHIFHFKVEMQVFHDDRDVEFIQAKRIIERWYNDGTLHLDFKSCEMMARELYNKCIAQWPGRDYTIEVSEDGENGCRLVFEQVNTISITGGTMNDTL